MNIRNKFSQPKTVICISLNKVKWGLVLKFMTWMPARRPSWFFGHPCFEYRFSRVSFQKLTVKDSSKWFITDKLSEIIHVNQIIRVSKLNFYLCPSPFSSHKESMSNDQVCPSLLFSSEWELPSGILHVFNRIVPIRHKYC